jgi:protein SCO1
MSRRTWLYAGIALFILAVVATVYQIVAPKLQPLPVYMSLPDVTLIDQDGQPFALSQTRGKIVVVAMIYTHCPDVCPLTTSKMKQLQQRLQSAGWSDQVDLVSITVDPDRDTPDVLKRFAGVYKVDPSNWQFLTGASDQIQQVVAQLKVYVEAVYLVNGGYLPKQALAQPPAEDAPYYVNHSDLWFLADRQGRVRSLPPGSRSNVSDVLPLIRQLLQG